MTLTKSKIVAALIESEGIKLKKTAETVETVIELIRSTLESGEDVLVSGFGKFEVKEKAERRDRNSATGEDLTIDARRIVTFKCSGKLREKVNGIEN